MHLLASELASLDDSVQQTAVRLDKARERLQQQQQVQQQREPDAAGEEARIEAAPSLLGSSTPSWANASSPLEAEHVDLRRRGLTQWRSQLQEELRILRDPCSCLEEAAHRGTGDPASAIARMQAAAVPSAADIRAERERERQEATRMKLVDRESSNAALAHWLQVRAAQNEHLYLEYARLHGLLKRHMQQSCGGPAASRRGSKAEAKLEGMPAAISRETVRASAKYRARQEHWFRLSVELRRQLKEREQEAEDLRLRLLKLQHTPAASEAWQMVDIAGARLQRLHHVTSRLVLMAEPFVKKVDNWISNVDRLRLELLTLLRPDYDADAEPGSASSSFASFSDATLNGQTHPVASRPRNLVLVRHRTQEQICEKIATEAILAGELHPEPKRFSADNSAADFEANASKVAAEAAAAIVLNATLNGLIRCAFARLRPEAVEAGSISLVLGRSSSSGNSPQCNGGVGAGIICAAGANPNANGRNSHAAGNPPLCGIAGRGAGTATDAGGEWGEAEATGCGAPCEEGTGVSGARALWMLVAVMWALWCHAFAELGELPPSPAEVAAAVSPDSQVVLPAGPAGAPPPGSASVPPPSFVAGRRPLMTGHARSPRKVTLVDGRQRRHGGGSASGVAQPAKSCLGSKWLPCHLTELLANAAVGFCGAVEEDTDATASSDMRSPQVPCRLSDLLASAVNASGDGDTLASCEMRGAQDESWTHSWLQFYSVRDASAEETLLLQQSPDNMRTSTRMESGVEAPTVPVSEQR